MEKVQRYGSASVFLVIAVAGIFSAFSCIAAEIKKSKKDDLKLDDEFCYLPRSAAFGYGIAALVALSVAEAIGNLTIIWWRFCTEKKSSSGMKNPGTPTPAVALLIFSWEKKTFPDIPGLIKLGSINSVSTLQFQSIWTTWSISRISFGFAIVAVSAATSMNERQTYGKGWLEAECYLVKDGVYIGSAVLVLLTTACLLGSLYIVLRRTHVDQGLKIHAQVS